MPDPSAEPEAQRPQIQMAFACESISSDPGGPVSFRNVMDGIAATDFPAPTGRWFAIFCFFSQVEMTIPNCRVTIADQTGEVIAQQRLKDVAFTPENPISRNVVSFQGLHWPHPGGYLVTFMANRDDVLAYFPMWVHQAPQSEESAQVPPT